MEVLALGFSRTGTMSLQHALQEIGYKCYHMTEVVPNNAYGYWLEALKAKYGGEGRPYQRAEFDKVLGKYSVRTECSNRPHGVETHGQSAKVILTERDVDSWVVSMNRTIFEVHSWRLFRYFAWLEPNLMGPFWVLFTYILDIWTGGNINDRDRLRQTYRDHYTHARKVVPKEKLLDFRPGGGYPQLCEFLGRPAPGDKVYPHINQPDNIVRLFMRVWWITLWAAITKIGGMITAIIVAFLAVRWYSYV
ncbi:MAG: hypothetical protein Q9222_006381 [Ikaeria aurantiellina]